MVQKLPFYHFFLNTIYLGEYLEKYIPWVFETSLVPKGDVLHIFVILVLGIYIYN